MILRLRKFDESEELFNFKRGSGWGGTNVSCQLKFCPFVSCQLNFKLFVSCQFNDY